MISSKKHRQKDSLVFYEHQMGQVFLVQGSRTYGVISS